MRPIQPCLAGPCWLAADYSVTIDVVRYRSEEVGSPNHELVVRHNTNTSLGRALLPTDWFTRLTVQLDFSGRVVWGDCITNEETTCRLRLGDVAR